MAPPAAPLPATGQTGPPGSTARDRTALPDRTALLDAGTVLARRYRLLSRVPAPDSSPSTLWRATDEVLARPVAVKVVPAVDPLSVAFLESVARAGAVEDRALTRVYDAAVEPRPRKPSVAYVVTEWVAGRDLPTLLAEGPLSAGQAAALAVQAAQALVAVHAADVVHARVHPGNVLVDGTGRLRLTDTAVAAALHGGAPAVGSAGGQAGDVRDLAAVAYALVTGRWPAHATGQPGRGLPVAPTDQHGTLRPRQVRAGVPRALDSVIVRALEPGRRPDQPALQTAPALLAALDQAARQVRQQERAAGPIGLRPHGRLRRLAPYVLVLALLGGLGAVCYSLGLSVGEVRPQTAGLVAEAPAPGAAPPPPGQPVVLDLTQAVVRDYDPFGSPSEENGDQVVNAYDREPSTAWATDRYRSAAFGGLKPGVGLLVDLGTPAALARVDVDVTLAGVGLELRAGDALGADHTALPVVARDEDSPGVSQLSPPVGTTARYWLVWITRLPAEGGQFRAGIDELAFVRA